MAMSLVVTAGAVVPASVALAPAFAPATTAVLAAAVVCLLPLPERLPAALVGVAGLFLLVRRGGIAAAVRGCRGLGLTRCGFALLLTHCCADHDITDVMVQLVHG